MRTCSSPYRLLVTCDFVDSRTTPFPKYKIKTLFTIALSCTLVSTCRLVPTPRGGEIIVFNNVFNKGLTRAMLGVMDIYPGVLTASWNLSLDDNSLNEVPCIRRPRRNKDADGLVLKKLPYMEVVGSQPTCLGKFLDWIGDAVNWVNNHSSLYK